MLDSEFWRELADRFRSVPDIREELRAVWLIYGPEDHMESEADGDVGSDPVPPIPFWEVYGPFDITQQFDPLARRGAGSALQKEILSIPFRYGSLKSARNGINS